MKSINDKEFLKKAKRVKLSLNVLTGEKAGKKVMKLMTMPASELKQITPRKLYFHQDAKYQKNENPGSHG